MDDRKYQEIWRKANPDKIKGYNEKYHKLPKYKEMMKAAQKRWAAKNKEHLAAYQRERRKRKKMMEVSI